MGHKHSENILFIYFHFIAMKDDKHTTFQLLVTKGDDEVVTTRVDSSIEYGIDNAMPSCIGVLQLQ